MNVSPQYNFKKKKQINLFIFPFLLLGLMLTFGFVSCQTKKLPTISITKKGKMSWDKKTACSIKYIDGDSTLLLGKIKLRGGSSSRYHKHSFTVELDKQYPLGKLPKDDDWILNANYIDKTFMRHKISYDIFREMHPNNIAPKSTYANILLNKEYKGLYVLMEKVNKGLIGLNTQDSMAMLFKDPPIFYKDKLAYVKDSLNYYQQKFPKISKSDKTDYLNQFKNFLFNTPDNVFNTEVHQWVDIQNLIDWHLMLLFSNNSDGILKNFYLYKLDADTPFRFAIWDYDHSYGRDGDNEMNLIDRPINCERSILLKRLLQNPNYTSKLKNRWKELNKSSLSIENFEQHIEHNNRNIRTAVETNFTKWPVQSKWYYDDNNYQQELELLRKYIHLRIKQLNKYFNSL